MKRRIGIIIVILGISVILGVPVLAQERQETPTKPSTPRAPLPNLQNPDGVPNVDPLSDVMFPPDLIMRHGRELGLTDQQKSFMRGEIQRTTTRFNELQWQLQDAMEALGETMKSNSVNEQQALAHLDKVLDAEREIKRLHIGMGIRIKNQLTPEQQQKLHAVRLTPRMGGPGRRPGPGPAHQ